MEEKVTISPQALEKLIVLSKAGRLSSILPGASGRHALCGDNAANRCQFLHRGVHKKIAQIWWFANGLPMVFLKLSLISSLQVDEDSIVEVRRNRTPYHSDAEVAGAVPESKTMALLHRARAAQSTDQDSNEHEFYEELLKQCKHQYIYIYNVYIAGRARHDHPWGVQSLRDLAKPY